MLGVGAITNRATSAPANTIAWFSEEPRVMGLSVGCRGKCSARARVAARLEFGAGAARRHDALVLSFLSEPPGTWGRRPIADLGLGRAARYHCANSWRNPDVRACTADSVLQEPRRHR